MLDANWVSVILDPRLQLPSISKLHKVVCLSLSPSNRASSGLRRCFFPSYHSPACAMFLEFLTFCSYTFASSAFISNFLSELWIIQLAPFLSFYKWDRKHLETSLRSLSACAQAQKPVCLTLKPVLLMTFMAPQGGVPSRRMSRVICSMGILQARILE